MNLSQCSYCGNDIPKTTGDEHISGNFNISHVECKDRHQDEMQAQMDEECLADVRDDKKNQRILKKLKRTLKPKIWQAINWEIESHSFAHLQIVTTSDAYGEKLSGNEYFRQSTAIRHVYDNTSSDAHSDCYGGDVYLYIGKQRYLKLCIWG